MRPHVVWFGEMPFHLDEVYGRWPRAASSSRSARRGKVYPAAGFVAEASAHGARTVELNLDPSEGQSLFDEKVYGRAGAIVPAYVERLLARGL